MGALNARLQDWISSIEVAGVVSNDLNWLDDTFILSVVIRLPLTWADNIVKHSAYLKLNTTFLFSLILILICEPVSLVLGLAQSKICWAVPLKNLKEEDRSC